LYTVKGKISVELQRFSALERDMLGESKISLVSVGVDIGSSTSHLIFSRLDLERQGSRYVIVDRTVLHESAILLTPYATDNTSIDAQALGRFIEEQYASAKLAREDVDTGALILTGVALLRENARAIADLFAEEAGKFVAVSAGDSLEAIMAAHGSGAASMSSGTGSNVMNVDIGGGTTKLVICTEGRPESIATVDIGARLVAFDDEGTITRLEDSGRLLGRDLGIALELGKPLSPDDARRLAKSMAEHLFEHIRNQDLSEAATRLLRTPRLSTEFTVGAYTFSGGVSEYIYQREPARFGDLGSLLGSELDRLMREAGLNVLEPAGGIRATVIGASQYSVQVSGSTIFVHPDDAVPVRNVPVIRPAFELPDAAIDASAVAAALRDDLERYNLNTGESPVAIALRWQGSATYDRLDSFCKGVTEGMAPLLARNHPVILVYDTDVGGLAGIHLKSEMAIANPVISIDGIELRAFDFVDIGSLIPSTGAVPVVIKSLVFPGQGLDRPVS
jgi:ethanolamine utilization protein EutA